jgi:hypothetical protein
MDSSRSAGINWLSAEPQRFTDAPREWSTDSTGVHVILADGEELVLADLSQPDALSAVLTVGR